MKRSKRTAAIILTAMIVLLASALLLRGGIAADNSGETDGERLYWNGTTYIYCAGKYTEGETIAKTKDGWEINAVKEDDSHTFVVLRSFTDQYLMVNEDFHIPDDGDLSVAVWNGERIAVAEFCDALSEILQNATTNYQYETDNIFELKDGQKMRELYVGYDNCPVATLYAGHLGTVNGEWYLTTADPFENGSYGGKTHTVYCYSVPLKYVAVLEKYIS